MNTIEIAKQQTLDNLLNALESISETLFEKYLTGEVEESEYRAYVQVLREWQKNAAILLQIYN